MAVAYLISLASVYVLIGLLTTPVLWIWGVVDAYRAAIRLNVGAVSGQDQPLPSTVRILAGFLGALVILLIIVGVVVEYLNRAAPYIYSLF
jgi:hypothetical protein